MNYLHKCIFKVRDLLRLLPKTNYSFLDNYATNFVEFQVNELQRIREIGIDKAAIAVSQFLFKASLLTAFSLIQNKYDFDDEEFLELLELENKKNLQLLKEGKFDQIFPESFKSSKFDIKFHNILMKAFDFMVLEFKEWSQRTSILQQITAKLDNHEQNFKSIKRTRWESIPTNTFKNQ